MRQTPVNATDFIARHSRDEFRHKPELFAALQDNSIETNSYILPCAHLLRIYRRRLKHLQRHDTPYAKALCDDVSAVCDALDKTSATQCRIWSFSLSNSVYTLFEAADGGRIL